jgi:hypothetical protein
MNILSMPSLVWRRERLLLNASIASAIPPDSIPPFCYENFKRRQTRRLFRFAINIRIFPKERLQMRKSQYVDVLSRRLNVRKGRLTSMVQRASESGRLRTNAGRRPDFDVEQIEAARMLILALVDEGLAAVGNTVDKYGQLRGRGASFEEALGHLLARPEMIAPTRSGLEIHTDSDSPFVVMTTALPDGVTTQVYGDMPDVESDSIERLVTVSGSAMFSVAMEIAGRTPAEVDALLGATEMNPAAEVKSEN